MSFIKHKEPSCGPCDILQKKFPFEGYIDSMSSHLVIAEIIKRYVKTGATILDFGSGPCDKTALLALNGYTMSACDDLSDAWHLQNDNQKKITDFAKEMNIDFFLIESEQKYPYKLDQFDLIMMNDVLEHLHDSPYELLCQQVEWIKPNGLLLITVPNAANLRKRLDLLRGRTNYPPYEQFFWYPIPWRGHVREYVLGDLEALARFMNLEIVELGGVHKMVERMLKNIILRYFYLGITDLIPTARDSLLLLARKPENWSREQIEKRRAVAPV